MNIAPGTPFDLIRQRVWFGVELIDPLRRNIVSRNVRVALLGDPTQPIISASGRFAWWMRPGALPQAVDVTSADNRYLSRRYALDFQQAPAPAPLFRLLLTTTQAYSFANESTLVRGRLLETKPVANLPLRPIDAAELRLRWSDVERGALDGPPSATSRSGDFAAALPLPPGARPRTKDGSLVLYLVIQRRDLPGAAQARTVPLTSIREAQPQVLPQAIFWDELP